MDTLSSTKEASIYSGKKGNVKVFKVNSFKVSS